MSSTIDPAKLKVVELRAELSQRGLDTKGNKPALVQRLKKALEEELKEEIPDTSIADTSTEDLDTSQTQDQPPVIEETKPPEKIEETAKTEELPTNQCTLPPKTENVQNEVPPAEEMQTDSEQNQEQAAEPENQVPSENKEVINENDNQNNESKLDPITGIQEENGEQGESKSRKSRWGNESEATDEVKEAIDNSEDAAKTEGDEVKEGNAEQKGEKRKHSPSPERSQRRRSKSPIKEDEPIIDNSKVQLSWYDSDLHLQLDKESFLSAKPYHEGAFGFAWAGVRATHGVSSGKVCFEVKITEELQWEDFSKHEKTQKRDHNTSPEKKKAPEDGEKKAENGDKTEEQSDKTEAQESMETDQTDEKVASKDVENLSGEDKTACEQMETEENKSENPPEEPKKEDPPAESEQEQIKLEPLPTHLFRVGWSILASGLQLGEDKFSYGYESTGKFVTDKQFQEYGIQFGVGDVIGNFLSLDDSGCTISYTVNGEVQPTAITIPKSELPENFALFPHVSSRNFAFELNLGGREEAWFEKPTEFSDYEFLEKIDEKVIGPVRPETRNECEVILMFGLPASGKTHWVREHVKQNLDKRYTLIGSTHLLEKMTIQGETLKSKYQGNWTVLLDKLQKSLNKLIDIAALRRRNYIIDQTNVFPSAQRRKLRPFEGFKRRAVVVVVGDEEQAKRQSLQEAQDGNDVPDSAVFEMKANMTLPQKGDWIDEVIYAGVNEEEAKALVQKYNTQGREAGYGIQRRYGHRDDRNRWQNRRNNFRGNNYRDRSYYNNRYDRGPPRQGNWHPQRPGGWNRDRRDNRGPPMGGNRDWRNNRGGGGSRDRPANRDSHSSNYNRNRQPNRSGGGGNWQSGNWGQGGNWNNQAWAQQGTWGQGGWGGQQNNQNQWKYGGGSGSNQGYGSYGNWNYYGQYPQNWNAQGQTQAAGTNAYGQYSQQEWAQYAQQYAQQGQNTSNAAASQSATQK